MLAVYEMREPSRQRALTTRASKGSDMSPMCADRGHARARTLCGSASAGVQYTVSAHGLCTRPALSWPMATGERFRSSDVEAGGALAIAARTSAVRIVWHNFWHRTP